MALFGYKQFMLFWFGSVLTVTQSSFAVKLKDFDSADYYSLWRLFAVIVVDVGKKSNRLMENSEFSKKGFLYPCSVVLNKKMQNIA